MPYYAIDWSRYTNHVDVRTPPDAANEIQDILLWTLRFCKLSVFYISYHLPVKHRWMWRIHTAFLFVLCTAFLIVACVSLRFLGLTLDARNVQLISIFVYLTQCTVSAVSLIMWQWRKTFKKFVKLLQSCTLGVGMMKQKDNLVKANYVVLALCGVWPLAWSTYFTLHVYVHEIPMPRPWNSSLLWVDDLNPMSFVFLIHMSVCWWLAHTLLIMYYAFSLTELHVLNLDLQSDENIYQVPVLKHYIAIHYRLTHLHDHINFAFKPLVILSGLGNVVLLYIHVHSLLENHLNIDDILFSSIVLTFVFSYALIIVLQSSIYEKMATFIFDATQLVAASDRNLYAEYYPVANNYQDSFWIKESRSSVIKRVAKVCVFALAFFLLLYHQRSWR